MEMMIKLLKLTGFKTYIGAIGMIANGVYLITEGQYVEGWTLISAGIATFGFRAKMEELKEKPQELQDK